MSEWKVIDVEANAEAAAFIDEEMKKERWQKDFEREERSKNRLWLKFRKRCPHRKQRHRNYRCAAQDPARERLSYQDEKNEDVFVVVALAPCMSRWCPRIVKKESSDG